jgi:hypothetical protein
MKNILPQGIVNANLYLIIYQKRFLQKDAQQDVAICIRRH